MATEEPLPDKNASDREVLSYAKDVLGMTNKQATGYLRGWRVAAK